MATRTEESTLEPFAITKKQAFRLIGMTKLVQRWLYWSRRATKPEERWVEIVREGGRGAETMIDFQSLKRAYQRKLAGIEPPLLPSERGAQ